MDRYVRPRSTLGYYLEDPECLNAWEHPKLFLRKYMQVANELIDDGADVLIASSGFVVAQCIKNEIFEIKDRKVPVMDSFGVLVKTAEMAAKLKKVSSFLPSRKAFVKPPMELISKAEKLWS